MKSFTQLSKFLFCLMLLGCAENRTPEEVVRDFTEYMSTGECEKAMELCVGEAQMHVQASIDSGCESYTTRIDSISCDINSDTAECFCYEFRKDYGQMKFPYKLNRIGNEWKLTVTTKDTEEIYE